MFRRLPRLFSLSLTTLTTTSLAVRAAPASDDDRNSKDTSRAAELVRTISIATPSIGSAWLTDSEDGDIQLLSLDSRFDPLTEVDRRTLSVHTITSDRRVIRGPTVPSEGISSASISPSGKRRVVFRKTPKKGEVMELWEGESLLHSLRIGNAHGPIHSGRDPFGRVSWSPDEDKIVYVAERKSPNPTLHYEPPTKPPPTDALDSRFHYQQDWGEQRVGVRKPRLYVASFPPAPAASCSSSSSSSSSPSSSSATAVRPTITAVQGEPAAAVDNPYGYSASQPVFSPDGNSIVYVAWPHASRLYGLVFCHNKPTSIHMAPVPTAAELSGKKEDKQSKVVHRKLSSSFLAQNPIFSPNGERLLWHSVDRPFNTHQIGVKLVSSPWPMRGSSAEDVRTVVDTVGTPKTRGGFPGLYWAASPPRCWDVDGRTLYINMQWGMRTTVIAVDTVEGTLRDIGAEFAHKSPVSGSDHGLGTVSLLEAHPRGLLLRRHSPNRPVGLVFVPRVSSGFGDPVVIEQPLDPRVASVLDSVTWETLSVPTHDGLSSVEALLLLPPGASAKRPVPLLSHLHGGPHSAYGTFWNPSFIGFLASGFAVVVANYRGSIAYGEDHLQALPGRAGDVEVKDCKTVIEAIAKRPDIDSDRVSLVGGSHGGWIGSHLIGQYPGRFRAAALLNPVTNMLVDVAASDITDWCHTEAGTHGKPLTETHSKLFNCSPIAHVDKVKDTAVLLLLGGKDLRVPACQGFEYYHALPESVPKRLQYYPDDCHPLSSPAARADHKAVTLNWLLKYGL